MITQSNTAGMFAVVVCVDSRRRQATVALTGTEMKLRPLVVSSDKVLVFMVRATCNCTRLFAEIYRTKKRSN